MTTDSNTPTPNLASQDDGDQTQSQHSRRGRPLYGPGINSQPGPDEREAVIGQSDLPSRAAGIAGEQAGAGVPGLGGAPGGTSNYGGVGLPGGSQRLGEGTAPTDDARLGGTTATGGLGTGGQPASGHGAIDASEVLPGGATRPRGRSSTPAGDVSNKRHHEDALKHADQGALAPDRGAMINDRPGSTSANSIPTHGDEAVTLERSARGNLGPDAQPLPVPPASPASPAPANGTDGGPALGGSLAENPRADPTQPEP